MGPPVGVQVGLELTNVAGALGSAASRLCNLALVDALQRSGSDIFTEEKTTSLIGQWRVNSDTMEVFKKSVAPSKSFDLSKYVDIALHAGAGPTVQAALRDKNPGYASMVLHLSLLSFACEDQSLAHALTTAFEKHLETTRNGLEKAPDYISLLGTIRACRQQTTEFPWNHYFDDVASKIKTTMGSEKPHMQQRNKRRRLDSTTSLLSACIEQRSIPYTALVSLVMWISKLQNMPEGYRLHLKCSTGLTTIVVWCHYVLDIACAVRTSSQTFCKFGSGESIVTLEAVPTSKDSAIVMEANDHNESLFSLHATALDPPIEPENRTSAQGFARSALKSRIDDAGIDYFACCCIEKCCYAFSQDIERMRHCYGSLEWTKLTQEDIQKAGILLFDLDKSPRHFAHTDLDKAQKSPLDFQTALLQHTEAAFLDLICAFARVSNLDECASLPLSLIAFEKWHRKGPKETVEEQTISLYDSFNYISLLLLGREDRKDDHANVILRSAWGWSLYFPCFAPTDPDELDTTHLHIRPGIPTRTRTGDRKTRIADLTSRGSATGHIFHGETIDSRNGVAYFPGISTAEHGHTLVGNLDENTFSVLRTLYWHPMNAKERMEHNLSFREMLYLRQAFVLVPGCHGDCVASPRSFQDEIASLPSSRNVSGVKDTTPAVIRPRFGLNERVFKLTKDQAREDFRQTTSSSNVCFLYVTRGEAARWLQMGDFLEINLEEAGTEAKYILVHRKCCLRHAFEKVSASLRLEDENELGLVLL